MTSSPSDPRARIVEQLIEESEGLLASITPGEWQAALRGRDDAHMCRVSVRQTNEHGVGVNPILAMTWHPEHIISYVGLSRQQCIDNAAFIAAAPRLVRQLLAALRDLPASEGQEKSHTHKFTDYQVCMICGKTEAAIEGCHHCDEADSIEAGRCWWCLSPVEPSS